MNLATKIRLLVIGFLLSGLYNCSDTLYILKGDIDPNAESDSLNYKTLCKEVMTALDVTLELSDSGEPIETNSMACNLSDDGTQWSCGGAYLEPKLELEVQMRFNYASYEDFLRESTGALGRLFIDTVTFTGESTGNEPLFGEAKFKYDFYKRWTRFEMEFDFGAGGVESKIPLSSSNGNFFVELDAQEWDEFGRTTLAVQKGPGGTPCLVDDQNIGTATFTYFETEMHIDIVFTFEGDSGCETFNHNVPVGFNNGAITYIGEKELDFLNPQGKRMIELAETEEACGRVLDIE